MLGWTSKIDTEQDAYRIRIEGVLKALDKNSEAAVFDVVINAIRTAAEKYAYEWIISHEQEISSHLDQKAMANAIFAKVVSGMFPSR